MVPRRVRAAGLVVGFAWLVLGARAFQLQVLQGDAYEERIRKTSVVLAPLHAKRGELHDAHGRVLARDVRTFELYVTPRNVDKDPHVLVRIARLLDVPVEEIVEDYRGVLERIEALVRREEERYRDLRRRGEKRYPWSLDRRIPFEAAFEIELHADFYPGVGVREALRREYPYGTVGSHWIGYLGRVTGPEYERMLEEGYFVPGIAELLGPEGVERLRRRGEFEKELVGRAGAERLYDPELRGADGLAFREKDLETGARSIRLLAAAEPGRPVALTVDIELQTQVEALIDADPHPHVVVLLAEARTGDIRAMATKPRYDPNHLVPPVDAARVREYFQDEERRPLLNRSISGQYQLGSIFKIVTAWAGLETARISTATPIDCRGKMFERDDAFRCWLYRQSGRGHGPIDLAEALEQSCNCYFYEAGRRMTLTDIEAAAVRLGYGARTGLGMVGEASGLLPSQARPRRWTSTDTMSLSIGQSSLLVTPVQVLQMMVVVANRGAGPRIGVRSEPRPILRAELGAGRVEAVLEGLRRVVQDPSGTAHKSGLAAFRASGKTGSAQTVKGKDAHAWFAGFAPSDDPKWAVVVLVEHGKSGGEKAAPIAARVLEMVQQP